MTGLLDGGEAPDTDEGDDALVARIRATSGSVQMQLLTELYWRFADIILSLSRRYSGRARE